MESIVKQRKPTVFKADVESSREDVSDRLYFYHEIAAWQQDNHFIKSGYIKETTSYKKCLWSLFYLHNEFVNIHSHLLPSLSVLALIFYYINDKLTIYDNYLGAWEKANFLQFGAAATACLLLSSTFHCIKSHSQRVSRVGVQLDYFGIIILITCSLNSILIFAFHDVPQWKYGFIGLYLVLGSICTVLTLDSKFATPHYRPLRALMFVIFGLSGVLPVLASLWIFGPSKTYNRLSTYWLILEGFFYISGAVLYAMRVPERFTHREEATTIDGTPIVGNFDIFGHSHQIFHVFVVIAAYCHWRALVDSYHYLHTNILAQI